MIIFGIDPGVSGAISILENKKILVQGVGNVGRKVVNYLIEEGSEVYVVDINQKNIDLISSKNVKVLNSDNIYDNSYDIISPCALGGAINEKTKKQLKCKAIVGGANNQLERPTIGDWLNKNNIIYAPDYLVNSGGVIAIASEINKTEKVLEKKLQEIAERLMHVLEESKKNNKSCDLIAKRIAWERINS